jgi:TonB family protein
LKTYRAVCVSVAGHLVLLLWITGHEVRVAYPVVYPDPPVARAELPRDFQGDVVIELAIDSQGNVVETKIVQAIGHGVDEKIEATLRQWHYQPATLDGVPAASQARRPLSFSVLSRSWRQASRDQPIRFAIYSPAC